MLIRVTYFAFFSNPNAEIFTYPRPVLAGMHSWLAF